MRPFLFLGLVSCLVGPLARGETLRLASGAARVSLVELYTSEGCSSCPPAERWLGSLRAAPGLWHDFVPVAFHVDYWNRLGWPDRFSARDFTAREYAYAAAWNSGSVYTPCFVKNGIEWTADKAPPPAGEAVGVLTATYNGAVVRAEFVASGGRAVPRDIEVHAAILGAGIVSKVTAGENGGETLTHDFVALALVQGATDTDIALKIPGGSGIRKHALAVWITRRGSLTPLQATGGWLE